jgi:CBS domain-containing protein
MQAPQEIRAIDAQLRSGQKVAEVRVDQFLRWFGFEKRGYNIVQAIRAVLEELEIVTVPDFDQVSYYSDIGFAKAKKFDHSRVDPTIRLRRLTEATRGVHACAPTEPLARIVPEMIMGDYSQVPVMTSERELKGVITWQSIASSLALGKVSTTAQDVMVPAEEVLINTPLIEAIGRIARQGYVLVRNDDKRVVGILTSWDLNEILMRLSGEFLALGEIEGYLRRLLHGKFTAAELQAVSTEEGVTITGPHELSLGEIQRLIETPQNWAKLGLAVDRAEFVKHLDRVRNIRNDVMHFDPEGIVSADLSHLEKFVILLRQIA